MTIIILNLNNSTINESAGLVKRYIPKDERSKIFWYTYFGRGSYIFKLIFFRAFLKSGYSKQSFSGLF